MSEARDLVERAYAAANARDAETIIELATPDIELVTTVETYHGPDGVIEWLKRLDETLEGYVVEVVGVEEIGDHVVVAAHQRGRGIASGVEIDHVFTHVWTLRDGRGAAMRAFTDRDQALAYVRGE